MGVCQDQGQSLSVLYSNSQPLPCCRTLAAVPEAYTVIRKHFKISVVVRDCCHTLEAHSEGRWGNVYRITEICEQWWENIQVTAISTKWDCELWHMVVRKYRFAAIFSVLIQTYNWAFVYYYIDIGLQKSADYQNPESRSRRETAAMFYSSLVNLSGKTQKHLFYLSLSVIHLALFQSFYSFSQIFYPI